MIKTIQPKTQHLKRELAQAARMIAERLNAAGHSAWIVGGAVRDLSLGRTVKDLDMATSALPDEVEALFDQTVPVGKAFGTMVVICVEQAVEVTTFRSEQGYGDGRHPDKVEYSATPEEDARRRDFTCNALFLDPLTEQVLDPEGGLEDLAAGLLRAIGVPRERFREDGLRLMRLARFHAKLDLEICPETHAAALAESGAIERISKERILQELQGILGGPHAARAMGLLNELGVLAKALPGWSDLHGSGYTREEAAGRRMEALAWLENAHAPTGLALLFDGLGKGSLEALEALKALKPSRELLGQVQGYWKQLDRLEALWPAEESQLERGPDRSARLVILADSHWSRARELAGAFGDARSGAVATDGREFEGGHLGRMAREVDSFAHGLTPEQVAPDSWVKTADLMGLSLEPGPRFGALLGEAYELQLQAQFESREQALAWLEQRVNSAE